MAVTSIFVKTRCVQQAWHGGCEQSTPICSQTQINALIAALNRIYPLVDGCFHMTSSLKDCLKRSHTSDCTWTCADLGPGVVGRTSGSEITITPAAFASTQSRLDAIIFHEMVHRCGGEELDSEAFENHRFQSSGATAPTSDDFPKFRDDGGDFVNWNGATGVVTTKGGTNVPLNNAAFVDPNPPVVGGW
jgi:hypothetical protein